MKHRTVELLLFYDSESFREFCIYSSYITDYISEGKKHQTPFPRSNIMPYYIKALQYKALIGEAHIAMRAMRPRDVYLRLSIIRMRYNLFSTKTVIDLVHSSHFHSSMQVLWLI